MDRESGGKCAICGEPHETGACFKVGSKEVDHTLDRVEDLVIGISEEGFEKVRSQLENARTLLENRKKVVEPFKKGEEAQGQFIDCDEANLKKLFENFEINGQVVNAMKLYEGESFEEIFNDIVAKGNEEKDMQVKNWPDLEMV